MNTECQKQDCIQKGDKGLLAVPNRHPAVFFVASQTDDKEIGMEEVQTLIEIGKALGLVALALGCIYGVFYADDA